MLKIIGIVVVVLIAAVLLHAANKPDTFSVQRSASIQAPPERIFPLINDLRAFNTWNPFEKKDPNLKGRYSGPAGGKGAEFREPASVPLLLPGPVRGILLLSEGGADAEARSGSGSSRHRWRGWRRGTRARRRAGRRHGRPRPRPAGWR